MNDGIMNFASGLFGWPTLILALIPIAVCVRIFVRTSRWSILKVSAISVSGTLILSAWLFYASIITDINLQTSLGMGFARSARVMSQLEAAGVVGPQDPKSKNREVLVTTYEELDLILKSFTKDQ